MNRPKVTIHFAQTLDGHIDRPAAAKSAVISNPEGFVVAHTKRSTHDAVLVGIRTVLRDDPKLRVTRVDGPSPHRVVLDSSLRTPRTARVLQSQDGERAFIFGSRARASERDAAELREAGAEVVLVDADAAGLVDLGRALTWLRARGVATLLVEGGAQTIESFLASGFVDVVSVEVAPRFLGASGLPALRTLTRPVQLSEVHTEPLGTHVLISGVPVFQ